MSVESGHRKKLFSLLLNSFPEHQFIVNTHDKTWTNQLKSAGIVKSKGIIEFFKWHIDTGPYVNFEADLWNKINEEVERNNISAAAPRLRRGLEQFFGITCDALKTPVIYKLNYEWELGDLLPASINRFRKLLKKAKDSAQS